MRQEKVGDSNAVFDYQGPLNPSSEAQPQAPLTSESARHVALSAWRMSGRLRPCDHFTKRSIERKFDIFDIEQIIRSGKPKGNGKYCPKFKNYKYQFGGAVDGLGLRVVFAIDAIQDYAATPLVILITAAWNTKSGRRKR